MSDNDYGAELRDEHVIDYGNDPAPEPAQAPGEENADMAQAKFQANERNAQGDPVGTVTFAGYGPDENTGVEEPAPKEIAATNSADNGAPANDESNYIPSDNEGGK